jgi:2-hydroxymuconate-semialdehyde hydrolase
MKFFLKCLGGLAAFLVLLLAGFVTHANWAVAKMETRAYDDGAPGRYVGYKGHRWHVATKGNPAADPTGAPILLIHGFIASGHESFLTFKDRVAEHRAVIMPDLLTYGYSERVLDPGEHYTLPHTAAAMAAILDELGVSQVDLVGHSYGSFISAQFAIDYPHRVRKVVLMGAMDVLPPTPIERVIQLPLGIGRAVAWHVVAGGPEGYVSMICEYRPDCPAARPARIKDTTDALRAAMYVTRHTPYFAEMPAKFPGLKAPVLVLNGEDDFLIPPEDAKRLTDTLADARLQLISGANHMPYRQKLDETLNAVLDFLQPST